MAKKIDSEQTVHVVKPKRSAQIALAREIEDNLRRVYNATLTEEVPDRFIQLLAQLKDREGKS